MSIYTKIRQLCALLLLCTLFSSAAYAQATRTWVSGVGDDVNPCSRTAPCKTFAGAISKTAAGGTINAIDPAGYGAVTITKAITIDGGGTMASILSAGTNGIIVNAGVNDNVVLRNIVIEGVGTGLNGIRFLNGKSLLVENVTITNVTTLGIDAATNIASQLVVRNTSISGAGSGGIGMTPGAAGSLDALIDSSNFSRNGFGVQAKARSKVVVRNSTAANNTSSGFNLTGAATMTLDNCVASGSTGTGLNASGAGAILTLTRSSVLNNATGLSPNFGAVIQSTGDNRVIGNGFSTPPTPVGLE
ncbi:right-handed parallel beta-helix repeat-containing protein [Tahibacter harae]|uniref:Right-handed parallel beta-helix repeat-containing protein n=1 Tax=Tahibacter harae TaxID=2963937 RepID=A0ABT1QQK7_9GAMM|nr:right-handed parallel beta-helix repeat-containing protein [Tahibacter harae]MCQ4164585.1 right-handed parallel beta-helix repeat-containing protein [Tahibacter harae]